MARSGSEDLLDPHQIDELLQRYRLTGDRSLRNRVVEAHLDIAGFQVRRFARSGSASVEDLRQTALVAVINAAERYEAGHGASFRTFASRTIEGELKRYLRDRSWAVRPPRGRQEMYLHVRRCTEDLSHELHRSPTVAEVADRLGVSEEAVLEGMEAGNAREAEHIDPVVRPDDRPSGGHPLGSTDPGFEAFESHIDLRAAIAGLDERERMVLHLRYIDEMSQPEIAEQMGISQSYVSRIIRGALTGLRNRMDHDAAGGHPADGATGTGGPERAPGASTTVHRGRGTGTYDEESPMTASDTSASNPLSPGDEVQDPAREQVSDQTRRTEDDDARTASGADREPTEEEERLAEQAGDVDPSVGEHYQEMAERGADVQGEGQITP